MIDFPIPLSLYIHMPWCIKRCPYCDFNAHPMPGVMPEVAYVDRLLVDARMHAQEVAGRPIQTVFIGGGTPSLFSPVAYDRLFRELRTMFEFSPDCEMTMEANPEAIEHGIFSEYVSAGINRLSLGVQTFCPDKLKKLGRVHNDHDAHRAIETALKSGFNSINLDLMYGLPGQSATEALQDLRTALSFPVQHLSWYELTLEPNTLFYAKPPPLPEDNMMHEIEKQGLQWIQDQGFDRYEVSAFTKGVPARHNINYWTFGDYLGIGAGAHGKLTDIQTHTIRRLSKQPKAYLDAETPLIQEEKILSAEDAVIEFMLNALRLRQGFLIRDFEARTFQNIHTIMPTLQRCVDQGQLRIHEGRIQATPQGFAFLNDIIAAF
jgi:oxygen-independent coproporphyrinogen-3 oxidase